MSALVEANENNVQKLPTAEVSQGIAPMVQMVASGQISIEQLDHLMGLQERYEAAESRKAYNSAMTRFRADLNPAKKTGKNTHLNTTYATFDDMLAAASGPLGDNGFNIEFTQEQDAQARTVTVKTRCTHADGHSESTSLTSVIEGNKGINLLQALGLTISYLKRYGMAALLGLATEDNDGQAGAPTDQKPAAPAPYPDAKFKENWPSWVERVKSGKNKAVTISTQLCNGYTLTEKQMAEVMTLSNYEPKEKTDADA